MARWMGFGKSFQDGCKLNVHISGRQGPEGIIKALPKLSTEARNLITIENDEMGWGLDASLKLEKHLALVLDIHHHWIRDEEYIDCNDDRVKRVIDSWRGQRPTLHYSYSRDEALAPADPIPSSRPSIIKQISGLWRARPTAEDAQEDAVKPSQEDDEPAILNLSRGSALQESLPIGNQSQNEPDEADDELDIPAFLRRQAN